MQLNITTPLEVTTTNGRKLELMPVVMYSGHPSQGRERACAFLKPNERRLDIGEEDASRVQAYMRKHGTEALSEDGVLAFTIAGAQLVECDHAVFDVSDAGTPRIVSQSTAPVDG